MVCKGKDHLSANCGNTTSTRRGPIIALSRDAEEALAASKPAEESNIVPQPGTAAHVLPSTTETESMVDAPEPMSPTPRHRKRRKKNRDSLPTPMDWAEEVEQEIRDKKAENAKEEH